MRRLLPMVLVVVACAGSSPGDDSTTTGAFDRAAAEYATTAMRAIEGTAFDVLEAEDVADLVVGLCEGLGVGAIGVAVADTGVVASDDEVAIFLEVLQTGVVQVCPERASMDLTAVYLDTLQVAVTDLGAESAYDEIAAIRAAPVVCRELGSGSGGEGALLAVVESLYGIEASGMNDLEIGPDRALVAGAVLAAATAVLCPEHLDEVRSIAGSA
jgi:hypothetical protein